MNHCSNFKIHPMLAVYLDVVLTGSADVRSCLPYLPLSIV